MSEHRFRLIAVGELGDAEAVGDAVYEAGGEDALLGFARDGSFVQADFDREAETHRAAILSAVRTLEAADLRVVRVEADASLPENDPRRFDVATVNHLLGLRGVVSRDELLDLWEQLQPA